MSRQEIKGQEKVIVCRQKYFIMLFNILYIITLLIVCLSLYIKCPSRSKLNLKTNDSVRINCKGERITTAIISLPSPPSLNPDAAGLRGPPQRRPPPPPGHPAAPSIQTTASSAGINIFKVSAL